jgi:integrase
MEAVANNVVGFTSHTIEESINVFLDKLALKSGNTKSSYYKSICRFFMWHRGKELNQLSITDLQISNEKMIKYQLYLKNDLKYSNASVNLFTSAVMSLYEFLSRDRRYEVRYEDVKVDTLSNESEKYGELSVHEAEKMAQLAAKQRKGIEKSALIRMAYTTSFRKETLFTLTWSDIKFSPKDQCYLVTGVGKGNKKHTRPITIDLYNELLKLKEQSYYDKNKDNRIFHLSDKGLSDMMTFLRNEMEIDAERNVVFHSLRNVAAGYISETGGTLEEIRDQLNHSGYSALGRYMHKDKNYNNMAGLKMNEKIDYSLFENMSKEQLLELIFKQSEGTILTIQRTMSE